MSHSNLLHTPFVPAAPPSLCRRCSSTAAAVPPRRSVPVIQSKIREIFMPALSSTMTEGKIVSWVKSEGEKLAKGESVVVVESDKADMDVESFYDGYLAAIIVDEGLSAAVGSTIALLAETEEEIELAKSQKTVGYTITTDALDALYKKIKSKGVTMTALLAKATALALIEHPVVNSSCRDGKSFTYNSHINIAVAVAIDGGLITPVLQDADKTDIYSLSREWKDLVDKARAKQLQPSEYTTGTFTLSNLGMFGVDHFDAILPPGTGAIMAVGSSQPTVVGTKDGRIGLKTQMQVNVTADHRVIYGADLAAFLQTLSKIIEDPKDLTL
ncbi:Dihydrolipoyllysine-residue acetyltransferase component 5 of pyruvate dehydrogenase complex-chloroplastic [Striga hermonthica]|uniref:Dihydrolipoamide acetyltransferase component of pyruvate dehydrogenase complex n=1 Tax=Striga hermonthica TaxID=68872 RepID=A0A9N7MLS8_STRHE|nr:Dihydrolipoyllysine-residue acetyltransferase component 5 of pyruvate dehydrogenase complex-chloroplastic [Striga hermonthica]